ncbi:MAG: hypothetical protein ACRD68_06435, partial [Pyrinomonadaceae bacterium]
FEQSELKRRAAHQNGSAAAMTLLIRPDNLGPNPGAQEIERHARAVTGRPGARVKGVRETRDAAGRVVSYEVDIE